MSISRVAFWSHALPKLQTLAKTLRPSDCTDVTRLEASIMSISRVAFWSHDLPKLQMLAKPFAPVIAEV